MTPKELARAALRQISERPETWNQTSDDDRRGIDCGCFCHWINRIGKGNHFFSYQAVEIFLKIDLFEAIELYSTKRTLPELTAWVEAFCADVPENERMKIFEVEHQ